jgi:hypothetical protein
MILVRDAQRENGGIHSTITAMLEKERAICEISMATDIETHTIAQIIARDPEAVLLYISRQ